MLHNSFLDTLVAPCTMQHQLQFWDVCVRAYLDFKGEIPLEALNDHNKKRELDA